jgi:hypothetical protein
MTQQERVLRHLQDHKWITSLEAITEYGNTRLASSICELRKKGHDIATIPLQVKNRYGETSTVAKYILQKPLSAYPKW